MFIRRVRQAFSRGAEVLFQGLDVKRWRRIPQAALVLVVLALIAGLVWVLGPGAAWMLEHFDGVSNLPGKDLAVALDAVRGRALAIATGLIALVAVYYTARNAHTVREGHITDRYTKAIEQLGSDKVDIRLGGIYALERIARDSARDHATVMDVLAAFIREHSRDVDKKAQKKMDWPGPGIRTDIQAALTVICRRAVINDRLNAAIDLSGANISGANLVDARLLNSYLAGADLSGADLTNANLLNAYLADANLASANLTHTNMDGANLTGANLDGAIGLPKHLRQQSD